MEELIKIIKKDGRELVSARELHLFLGASERFSSWIDRQFQYGFAESIDYVGCKEFNALANQELQDYALTLNCAKEISMLQKSDKGKQARLYFIECENKLKSILPDFNNPAIAARAWADEYEKRQLAESKVKELQPKADVTDMIANSSGLLSMNETAKILGTTRNKLFKILRDKEILMSSNVPYQKYIPKMFLVKSKLITMGEKSMVYTQTFVTPKGLTWLAKGFANLK